MCIIMSLNVNEMELKDPKRRTCGMLHKERKGWGGGKQLHNAEKNRGKNVKAMFICGDVNI